MSDSARLTTAYLGLGANLGDPVAQLIEARSELYRASFVQSGRCSSFFVSSPVGYQSQPDFINCVLELQVVGGHRPLFEMMQGIEVKLGRERDPKNQNAPRIIDLDLLLFGEQVIEEIDLLVPHPRIRERRFVLEPLCELNQALAAEFGFNPDADLEKAYADQELFQLKI